MPKIIILGGGLSGLTLGYFLNREKEDYLILEKEPVCGGLMKSIKKKGFTFDIGGSHIIFSRDQKTLKFITGILGNNKIKNRRNTKILYKGRFVKYPFENGLADLPLEENFVCLNYFIKTHFARELKKLDKPKNFEEWMYYNFGKGITEKYLLPYNKKIWKFEPKDMSLEWVSRVPQPPMEDIIKSSLGINTEGYTHQLYFYYPLSGGIQEITSRLEDNQKNSILKGCEIKKICKKQDKWVVSTSKGNLECEKIISTIPLFSLADYLEIPEKVRNAINNLKYNSLITVMLGLRNPKLNNLSWLYIPDEKVLTHRVSFPSNYAPENSPDGCSSVLSEITYNQGDNIDKMSDVEIIERTIRDLSGLGLIDKKEICFTEIKRIKYAYVVYDLNYEKNIQIIYNFFKDLGIGLCGRFSEFKYLNMDACIKSAGDYIKNNFS